MIGPRHKRGAKELERYMPVVAVCREMRRSRTMPRELIRAEVQVKSPADMGQALIESLKK